MKEQIAQGLEEVRSRTLDLLDPLDEADQIRQHSPLMSPVVWDLAHVGNYEEIWLLRTVAGLPAKNPDLDDIYDAFKHARKDRRRLRLLGPVEARSYISDVRGQVIDGLEDVELDPSNPLLVDGYLYGMCIQHEHQHDETILASLALRGRDYPLEDAPPPPAHPPSEREVHIDGGSFSMGTAVEPWAYDNERPAHEIEIPPFYMDTAPVSNAEYIDFIEAGGYDDRRHWSDEGWGWRQNEGLEAPLYWDRSSGGWARHRFGLTEPVPPTEPVQHVGYYEAEAFATWAGKRLPTEQEWEKAASWDPQRSRKLRFPWGDGPPTVDRANINQLRFRPTPIGSFPKGVSPWGCHQMIGDVWEWCSSEFDSYPGYEFFPYQEYSEVFFRRGYKVLRGGSWATHPSAIRNTFRNWDFPIRRQIFCGFRCARDAA